MSEEEKSSLSEYIINTSIELNAQYPGCLTDEEVGNLVLGSRTLDIPYQDALELVNNTLSKKVEGLSDNKPKEEKGRILKLTKDEDGFTLSNSVIVLVTLTIAFLIMLICILVN